ncbi:MULTISPECIES: alanine racemase [Acidobacterium]|uniref:alanine racemase n=1 Tax=Acidobacterium TaxID=33973 RepID=UPI000308894B|nr:MULTISPECIES: alanine racemase [Acidobacterium]
MSSPFTRPVWAEISRARLLHNFSMLQQLASPDIRLAAVVKANAYGHGATLCAPWLAAAGAEWLGVTSVEEGVAVRAVCATQRILVMSGLWQGEAEAVLEHCLTPVVWEPFHLDLLARAARQAKLPPQALPVHLEIDTGMSRQGAAHGGLLEELLRRLREEPDSPLLIEGVLTHFHSPDELDSPVTAAQIAAFATAVDTIAAAGLAPALLHAGNSTSLLTGHGLDALRALAARHHAQLMLRPGLALYGYTPQAGGSVSEREEQSPRLKAEGYGLQPAHSHSLRGGASALEGFQPVLSLKSRIVSLRTIAAGATAGYNGTFRAARSTRLALLPIGYADGLSRLLSGRGHVLVRGHRAPIAGRISMDQTILDVSGIPEAAIGDEAVLLGEQGNDRITAEDLAALCQTIPWEILTSIAARVPRVAVD